MLYAVQDSKNGSDLWAVPLDGGKPFPVVESPFDDVQGQFSPDGRFLVNVTADEGAPPPITVVLNWDATLRK